MSPDLLTYTFHIRRGVRWHDKPPVNGRELTAHDLVFTYQRNIGLGEFADVGGSPNQWRVPSLPVESVTAPDDYTFVIKLTNATATTPDAVLGVSEFDGSLIVGQGMTQIVLVIGVTGGIGSSRLVRSAVIGIKENDYFQAAEAIGGTHLGTLARHIMPNIMPPIIIVFSEKLVTIESASLRVHLSIQGRSSGYAPTSTVSRERCITLVDVATAAAVAQIGHARSAH